MILLRWLTQQVMHLLGWQGVAGIVLVVASTLFGVTVFAPLESRVTKVKSDTPAAYERQKELRQVAAEQDPSAQLSLFYAYFKNDDPLTDWLGRLYSIGEAHRLALRKAEYRELDNRTLRLQQYQVVVPLTATYPQLKQFLAAVLTEIPIVSLDAINLQRRKIGDSTVDVQLQFTLYLPEKNDAHR